jgi:peptide/nickel transport system substrate-binding protein
MIRATRPIHRVGVPTVDAVPDGDPMERTDLSRRKFLAAAAGSTAVVALAACGNDNKTTGAGGNGQDAGAKGSAKSPLPKPSKLNEAPMLADQVKAGSLPAVDDRVGPEPYVVPHNWLKQGKYGGALRMQATSSTDGSLGEWWYSHSPLRFLNDGGDVGPGWVTKWEANADASVWTFTLRKGIKWSDGHPVSTDDILFWWDDMINYKPESGGYPETAPDECKSGKGTLCKITAKDAGTFVMSFDSPAPLTADRMAMWTNGPMGIGPNWIVPAHYVKNFHPKYNKNAPKDWTAEGGYWQVNCGTRRSTKCPTLAPYKLTKYSEGRSLQWERNPYSYEVTKEGDQLPYIDRIQHTVVSDPQVAKVQMTNGQVDLSFGGFNGLALSDVAVLKRATPKSKLEVLFWDGGDGTASSIFFNQDYIDKKYRDLFGKPEFLKGLSMAFNRDEARKSIYFEQGEITTGTMSPKAIEFRVNAEGEKIYKDWRDDAVTYDPAAAKTLLDGIGLKDKDGDGYREFPDGSKLSLRADQQADTTQEHKSKNAQLVRDWKAVGVKLVINPVPPTSYTDNWINGKYMTNCTWGIGDGPNCLLYPQWLLPMENTRWAPLQGEMYNSKGRPEYTSEADVDPWKRHPPRRMPEKGGVVEQLWNIYEKTKTEPDVMKRTQSVWELVKLHTKHGPFVQGTVCNVPTLMLRHTDIGNVPMHDNLALGGFTAPWIHPTPAVYDPETFFWNNPDEHSV